MSDRETIVNAMARYARGVDERDFAAVAALFTPDASIDYSVTGGAQLKGSELAAWLGRALAVFRMTQHHLGLPEVEMTGDAAHTYVPVIATHVQTRHDGSETTAVLNGSYTHEWARTADGWRIRTLRFVSHHATGTFLPPSEVRLYPPS